MLIAAEDYGKSKQVTILGEIRNDKWIHDWYKEFKNFEKPMI
jgi:hypothetical protein